MRPNPVLAASLLCLVLGAVAADAAETGNALPADLRDIVFAVRQPGKGGHWYENFGYYAQDPQAKAYGALGQLCRLDVRTGRVTVLLDDPKGGVRDPQVHYDGGRILFSYRPAGTDHYHLHEIGADGTGLRRLTSGPFDDIEPVYLPDGRIMFCSSRCNQWVPCWFTQVAVLYSCDADGSNPRRVSANIEHDNTPWVLPDGRVLYERWEYVDRSRVAFHHLWTVNPDGTGQMVYYGNQHPGTVMLDAKPIPGTDDVVAIFSPGHGKKEHAGAVTVVTPIAGPDDRSSARRVSAGEDFRDPYPLARDAFLVARGPAILLMDGQGRTREVYRLPEALAAAGAEVHEPRPVSARPRERVIPDRVSLKETTGRMVLSDIYVGRRMEGVRRGEIRKLLVLETLPKPVNDSGKMPPISFLGTYTLERVLGTVPVEPDGSAYFEVPAMRSLFFVALDEHDESVKRMMSFVTVQPGETTGCVGCHERRTQAPPTARAPAAHASVPAPAPGRADLMALRRPPSRIEPLAGIPDVFDFPRDVQPILDRHCVACHDYDRAPDAAHGPRAGGVILTGDRGPIYSHAYYTLVGLQYVSDGRDRLVTNLPPRTIGSSASRLMRLLDGSHYGAAPSAHERDTLRYWIESGAVYAGTYAAIGTGQIGGYPKSQLDKSDRAWPASVAAAEAIGRRCAACHDKARPVPRYMSDDLGLVLSNPDDADVRIRWSRHLLFNLSRPEKSLMLLAPLARSAGGLGLCTADGATGNPLGPTGAGRPAPAPVFADAQDPDYRRILSLCREGHDHLDRIKRFDMPGFRPPAAYAREMKRYGLIDREDGPLDPYALDQAYWRSMWWTGAGQ